MSAPTTGAARESAAATGGAMGRAVVGTGVGTLLSRLTGLLRLVVIAAALGGHRVADAFNLANNTPNMVHDLVLGGVLAATFVPVFVERMTTRTAREAADSMAAVVTLSFALLVVATIAFVAAAPWIIDLYGGGALTPSEHALSVDLLRLFAPQLFFYGAISVISALLATRDRFIAVGFVPVLNNVVSIIVLLAFLFAAGHSITPSGVVHDSGLLLLLGVGTTAGVAVQALALVPSLRASGVHLAFRWRPHDPAVRRIINLSGWTFGFVVTSQIALFVVLALEVHLSRAVPGSLTAYTYAYQFFQMPFGVVAVSVINVASPDLSRAWARGDLGGVGRRFGIATRRTLALVLPATVGYLLLADPIVTLLLRHHAETTGSAQLTAHVLVMFALGLPGFCVFLLATRAFQAMQETRTAFVLYLLQNIANVALALGLYHPLAIRGLALAYSISYSAAALVALVVLRRRCGTIGGRALAAATIRCLALSAIMAFVVAFVAAVFGTSGQGLGAWFGLISSVVAGAVVYLGGAGIAGTLAGWQTSRRRRGGARRHSRRSGARYSTGH